MTHPLTAKGLPHRLLPGVEWLAENAYIPPGAHRLLTAGGLSIGLFGGRAIMDVVTARKGDGGELPRDKVAEIFRPFHGTMRYNPYADDAADRWRSVIDKLAPMTLGALGAWAGSKLYIHDLRAKPFHPASKNVLDSMKRMHAPLATADAAAGLAQGDAIRRLASPLFAIGSSTGTHLFGGLFPFTNSMSAQTFMQSVGRKLWVPGLGPVNRFFGNRSMSARYLYGATREHARWMEANILKFAHADEWATDAQLHRRARDLLQVFTHVTPAQEQAMADQLRQLIATGYQHKPSGEVYKAITEGHVGLFDVGYERLVKATGIDLSTARLGDNGPFTAFARMIGSGPKEKAVWKQYAEHLNRTHGYTLDAEAFATERTKLNPLHAGVAYAAGIGTLASGLAIGGVAANRMNRRFDHLTPEEKREAGLPGDASLSTPAPPRREPRHHGGNLLDWLNDKPLDVAQWLSRVAINPPSMHRFMNAAYLSATLYGGMKFANVLAGRNLQLVRSGDLSKSVVDIQKVWAPLKPLYGKMAYTPGSVALQDRWRQAAHLLLPVTLGAFGTFTGSHMFFQDRIKKLERPDTLEDYADKIALEQSKPYAGLTALTSIFNTGSGIHLLPVFNYSSNLHNRYLLASGHQVALPGLGQWWSGNPGLTPWGVKRGLDYLTNYLTYNPEARPKEVASLTHAILGKLYPQMSEPELLAHKQAFINQLHAVRDTFLTEDGTVARGRQGELKHTLQQMLHGRGFESMLLEAGLDPAKANLASNGASGKLANALGTRHTVQSLAQEYRGKFAERLANHRPKTTAQIIAEHAAQHPQGNDNTPTAANDNPARSHSDRVKDRGPNTPLPTRL